MKSRDCKYCGGPPSSYPNCCHHAQFTYKEKQKKRWAREKAEDILEKKHKDEIFRLMNKLLDNREYENDSRFFDYYLSRIKPIKGAK